MVNSEWNGLPLPAKWCEWQPVWKQQVIAYLQGRTLQPPIRWSELSVREKQLIIWHLCAVGSVSPQDHPRVRLLGGKDAFQAMRKCHHAEDHDKTIGSGRLYDATAFPEIKQDPKSIIQINLGSITDGMLYPKPNGGKRILPSVYTKLTHMWLRATGIWQTPKRMNQGHLKNTVALLNESHINLVDRMTDILGRMHNHLGNRPDLQAKIVDLFHEFENLQVDELYPIVKLLASHIQPKMEFDPRDFDENGWLQEF